jgi:hypothetical protein
MIMLQPGLARSGARRHLRVFSRTGPETPSQVLGFYQSISGLSDPRRTRRRDLFEVSVSSDRQGFGYASSNTSPAGRISHSREKKRPGRRRGWS